MRRRLVAVFVAVSTLVAVAFVLPLGFLVKRTAEDRAIDSARADAAAVVPALVADGTRSQIESAVGATVAGREQRMTVLTSQGWTIGQGIRTERVDRALTAGTSSIGEVGGGVEVVAAVATGPGELSAIRVFVSDSTLSRGRWQAWGALAGVGLVLVGISVVVADRLSRTIVRPAERLAEAALRLGAGELDVAVEPDGPPELMELGRAFNELGSRVGSMLDRERELVAELSHRLRTPLTKLRMRVDQVDDQVLSAELAADIADLTMVINELIREARGGIADAEGCLVATVVADRAEFWSVLAEDQRRPWRFEKRREPGLEPTGGAIPVAVGEVELGAALDALLENVFAHTPEETAVAVGFEIEGDMVAIRVEDAGNGIDPVAASRGTSTGGSTGLGLDIARRTAEDAGGSLEIATSRLGGALVTIRLPIASA